MRGGRGVRCSVVLEGALRLVLLWIFGRVLRARIEVGMDDGCLGWTVEKSRIV